ncbi:MAG: hypothetical protein HYY10_03420 [Candidatus Liptonbacteria bacterium]|nr:hypothetical protein [Candidatus Liptonbacteria bacterium]
MHWKKWPYWLRGGVIGGGIAIISAALTELCASQIPSLGYSSLGFECLPLAIPWIPLWPALWALKIQNTATLFFIGVVIWFFLGSLIGTLVGYIKKRKSAK